MTNWRALGWRLVERGPKYYEYETPMGSRIIIEHQQGYGEWAYRLRFPAQPSQDYSEDGYLRKGDALEDAIQYVISTE